MANPNLAAALEEARERYHREYDAPFEAMARERGELTNRQNTKQSRLREISPAVGSDNLIIDPADSDAALRAERVALRDEIHRIESSIREIDAKRREVEAAIAKIDLKRRDLESRAADARVQLEKTEFDVNQAKVFACMARLAAAGVAMDSAIAEALNEIDNAQKRYPSHIWLPGNIAIKAHAGAPAAARLLEMVHGAIKMLMDHLGEWNPQVLPAGHPSRERAEMIERANEKLGEATVLAQRRQAAAARERAAQRGVAVAPPAPPTRPMDMLDCYALVEAERVAKAQ